MADTTTTPVWLITGAGTGFGQAIALNALQRGHKVIATGRRLEALESLKAKGATPLQLDVTASEDIIAAKIKEANSIYGKLTYIANAAGYALEGALEEASEKEVFDQFNTNVFGTVKVCRATIPYLRSLPPSAKPTIVNFGSLASWVGGPAVSLYNGSKWAVSGITEALAAELAPFHIRVLCVEPGMFRTAFLNDGKRIRTAARMRDVYAGTGVEEYRAFLDSQDNKQLGDVVKGAEVVVDLVAEEGVGQGKELPVRILLGSDCVNVVREKCEGTLKLVQEWEDVSKSTDYETTA